MCSRHDGLIVYIVLIGQITEIISKLDRRISILIHLAASGQNGGAFESCSPMHWRACGCIILIRRRGSFRESIRRCVTLALPPARAAHLSCCAQIFLSTAALPSHSPKLRTPVCSSRCAPSPDACFAPYSHHEGLAHVGGAPLERKFAPIGSQKKSLSAARPPPPTATAQQQIFS